MGSIEAGRPLFTALCSRERFLRFLCWSYDTKSKSRAGRPTFPPQASREVSMNREQEYRQLASDVFKRASEEESAVLRAQWEILGARYLELADQSKRIDDNDTVYDPIPWDRFRQY